LARGIHIINQINYIICLVYTEIYFSLPAETVKLKSLIVGQK